VGQKETVDAYLAADPLLYRNLMDALRRGSATVLAAGEEGLLLHERDSGAYMMTARTRAVAEALLDLVPAGALFLGHELWYRERAMARLGLAGSEVCRSAVWTADVPPELPNFGGELRPLDESWAPWVKEHYSKDFPDLDYIRAAIARGMLGAFVDGMPAGFVGFHPEGSIGMLEVLPQYRRRGLGRALELGAVRLALSRGRYAFGHVDEDNAASLALQRELGLELSATPLFWLFD